jgi:hypothetical protein
MQEGTVQWDPIEINHQRSLVTRLSFLCFLTILVISLIKSISIAAQLWRFTPKLPREIRGENEKADSLAAAAIGVPHPIEFAFRTLGITEGHLHVLEQANNKFHHVCDVIAAKTDSLKNLTHLTLLVSALALVQGAITTLTEIMKFKWVGPAFLAGSAAEILAPVGWGLLLCASIYSLFSLFGEALARRRARWNHFYATAKSDLSAEKA